jgi:hypothetical protein
MNSDFEQIFIALQRRLGLTHNERITMRNHLLAHIDENPARAPWRIRVLSRMGAKKTRTSLALQSFGSALVLVLMVGFGTSYAAEGALPGDLLYPVKIHVNEQVQGALTTSQAARAQFDASLAGKRLAEAETLAALGRLTPVAQQTIVQQLDTVTKNFNEDVATLANGEGNDVDAAVAQTELEASLSAHAHVLAAISSSTPSTEPALAPIIAATKVHARSAAIARKQTEDTVAQNDGPTLRIATDSTKRRAEAQLKSVKILISSMRPSLGASSTAQIKRVASDTQESINVANKNMNEGNYGKAFSAILQAIKNEEETKINVDATLHVDHIRENAFPTATSTVELDDATSSAK